MKVYRLVKNKYKNDLSGEGAYLYGGRWNTRGTRVLYTAEHRSLALLEFLVHFNKSANAKNELVILEIAIPDEWVVDRRENATSLLAEQNVSYTQQLCPEEFKKGVAAIKVPSVVLPQESNILLNPLHINYQNMNVLSIDKVELDQRLFQW